MNKKSTTSNQLSEVRSLPDSQMPPDVENFSTEEAKPKERVLPYGIKPFQRLINSPNIYQ